MTNTNGAGQTQAEYDAFGYGMTGETYGLDYESAREATPQWYGVSWGNGNDGVSHMWPDYYVRCSDPWLLCGAAVVSNWNDKEGREYAIENCEIEGEREYTITGTILNPPDDDDDGESLIVCVDCGNEHTTDVDECEQCGGTNLIEHESESWCYFNGAWRICEVFPIDDIDSERSNAPRYDSLGECFTEQDLKEGESI